MDGVIETKKGAARGCKRPKSREETPKEGSGNARRYRTATTCHRNAQNASVLDLIFILIPHSWPAARRGWREAPEPLISMVSSMIYAQTPGLLQSPDRA